MKRRKEEKNSVRTVPAKYMCGWDCYTAIRIVATAERPSGREKR